MMRSGQALAMTLTQWIVLTGGGPRQPAPVAVKRRAAMLAQPAKRKLVKLAKAWLPPGREPNSRSGAVTTATLTIQVAAQIGGSSRGYH
jgi:hypothetical protein